MNRLNYIILLLFSTDVFSASSFGGKSFSSPSRSFSSSKSSTSSRSYTPSKNIFSSSSKSPTLGGSIGNKKLYDNFRTPSYTTKSSGSFDPKVFTPSYRTSRKTQYYSGYTPKSTYYSSVPVSNSYGPWDSLLLWSILDNVGDRQMYYHHSDDPYFKQWRSDVEKLAQTDPEIAKKLKSLDEDVAKLHNDGVLKNPGYITPNVDPDIYEANNIDFSKIAEIKICTGKKLSDFSRYSNYIEKITKIRVKEVFSNGSVDNLTKLSTGECDLSFTQKDVVDGYSTIKPIVELVRKEGTLLFCPKNANINSFNDLKNNPVPIAVPVTQTGSRFTLNKLLERNDIKTDVYDTIFVEKEYDKNSCVFMVTTSDSFEANLLNNSDKYNIVQIRKYSITKNTYDDVYVDSTKMKNSISKDTYKYWAKSGVDVLGVRTVLVTTDNWIDQNRLAYDIIMMEKRNLESGVE